MSNITIDRTSQRWPSGRIPAPRILVLHTTEGGDWPAYSGGATAPNVTIKRMSAGVLRVREHTDFDQYGRALRNESGGVETNRECVQIELIGTCDPDSAHKMYFWPDADDATLAAVAEYLRPILTRLDIPFAAPKFMPYPDSYGVSNPNRFTHPEWRAFEGICGHQHVPENTHGDPGAFPIDRLIAHLEDDMPLSKDDVDKVVAAVIKALQTDGKIKGLSSTPTNLTWTVESHLVSTGERGIRIEHDVAALAGVVNSLASRSGMTPEQVSAAAELGAARALDAKIDDAVVSLNVAPDGT